MDGPTPSEMGIKEEDLGLKRLSLSGKELRGEWPTILDPKQEAQGYAILRDPDENLSEPPKNSHISKLSYELTSGDKRLRFFAAWHQRDMSGPKDPNLKQYDILEKKFRESPPQTVVVEGNISDVEGHVDDPQYRIPSREAAIAKGEQAFMVYLVQQHNLSQPENRISVQGIDIPDTELFQEFKRLGHTDQEVTEFFVNRANRGQDKMYFEEREIRDRYIIDKTADNFKNTDKVDMVFGSGHAIRERQAWNELFDVPSDLGKSA